MEGIPASIEGMPRHDVLILDLPWNIQNRRKQAAEIVFLLGDADSSNIDIDYVWRFEEIWIGRNQALQ